MKRSVVRIFFTFAAVAVFSLALEQMIFGNLFGIHDFLKERLGGEEDAYVLHHFISWVLFCIVFCGEYYWVGTQQIRLETYDLKAMAVKISAVYFVYSALALVFISVPDVYESRVPEIIQMMFVPFVWLNFVVENAAVSVIIVLVVSCAMFFGMYAMGGRDRRRINDYKQ